MSLEGLYSFLDFFSPSSYRYSYDIWYIALLYQDTDQFWVWLWSIDFSRSYGPWTEKKNLELSVFALFFSYSFDIWYIALPYLDTHQVWICFWSIDFSRSYGPWTQKKITNYYFSGVFFFLSAYRYSFDTLICHTKKPIKFEFVLIHWFFMRLWPLDLEIYH
jgi:hypothetical protein